MGCVSSKEFTQLKNQIKNQIKYLGDRLIDHTQNNTENTFMKNRKFAETSIIQQISLIKNTQDKLCNQTIYQKFINKIKSEEFFIFKEVNELTKSEENNQKVEKCQCMPLSKDTQDLIKNYYEKLIDQKLQAFNEGKLLSTEFKNQLSWNIVNLNLAIMEKIVKDPQFKYTGNNFKSLEEFQKQFLGFLKKKYPRGDNLDAGQLSNEFKELVDFTDEYENDILTNAGFYFDNEDGFQIMKKIKLFINQLIDQTSRHYKSFQQLMKEQVFKTAGKDSFVIGRKIPQNVSKYKRIDKNSLEIHSNEIFRIMIKWIDDLQETVNNPSQKISSNSEWCFVRKQENKKPQLIKCAKYYRKMFIQQGLYQKIKQLNKHNKMNKNQSQIQKFNISLINSFIKVQRYFPLHLSKQQAQIIKFSEYNMKFYKQNVEQKLISLIKILIQAAKRINKTITYDNRIKPNKSTQVILNLVKFKISDLLRCKFEGNKEQIIEIKKKFQYLQSQNKIKIIKIKNRFNTDLSDAMIIFKIIKQREAQNPIYEQNPTRKDNQETNITTEQNGSVKLQEKKRILNKQFQEKCYLICQCQLILTQKSKSSNKKLHNIQTLNHYLYELERSPFKVLGQSILQLNYKYDIIKYTSKIKASQTALNVNFCEHQNAIQVKQLQVKNQSFSIVCARCWLFYQPFQNNSKIKACTKCFIYLCYNCNLKQNIPIQDKNQQNIELIILSKPQNKQLFLNKIRETIKEKYLQYFTLVFNSKKQYLKEDLRFQQNQDKKRFQQFKNTQKMFQMINQAKQKLYFYFYQPKQNLKQFFNSKDQIKVKQLILFLYKEYHQLDYEGTIERMFFMIMSFSKNRVILRGYKYEAYDQRLVNTQNQQESYEGHQLFQLDEYDILYYPRRYQQNCTSKTEYQKIFLFQKSKQLILDGEKSINYFYSDIWQQIQTRWKPFCLIYDMFMRTTRKPSLEEFWQFLMRKRLVYMSKELNDDQIMQLKTQFYLKKPIVSKKHFNELKLINLQNNKLKNPSKFLEDCKELQIVILRNNLIEQIRFNSSLDSLQVLQLKNNQIKQLEGLQNLKCLKILNLQNNKLKEIFRVKNSDINENQQKEQNNYCFFPFLKDLDVSKNELNLVFKIHAQKLERIDIHNNQLQDVSELLSGSLENLKQLYLYDNKISKTGKIVGQRLRIQGIHLSNNQLQDISQLLSSSLENLKYLSLSNNKISKTSKIAGQRLNIQKIDLQNNQLQDVSDLLSSSLENLKQLLLRNNKISKTGKIAGSALKLQKINLQNNQLQDVSDLLSSSLENLKQLDLRNNKISKTGKIVGQGLDIQTIYLQNNQLQDVSELLSSSLENLKQLNLSHNKISKTRKIAGQRLRIQGIYLSNNQLQDVSDLLSSSLENLKFIDLRHNKICKTAKMVGQKLKIQTIFLQNNQLQDVSDLLSSSLENLKFIDLRDNLISKTGKIAGQGLKIQNIYLQNNQLQDVSELLSSSLENLKYLNLSRNKISKTRKIAGQTLKIQTIFLRSNQLQDVSELLSSSLQNLKFIDLSQNKIRKTGKIAGQGQKIQTIFLQNNQLQDISELLSSSLVNLKQLNLENNKINEIKFINQSQLRNLRRILLKTNKFTQIPNLNAPALQHISLGQNDIKTMTSQQIDRFKCLKQISISFNQSLSKIPIFNHPTLSYFQSKQNNVQNILQFFKSNLPKLKKINLSHSNYLTQLPIINNFAQLKQLQFLQCPIVLDDPFNLIQQQNGQYSKLKVLKLSIKTSSQQQFNKQKQAIKKLLSTKIQTLQITRFIQKTPPKQQEQQKIQQIQIESKTIQPQNLIIPQSNSNSQNAFEMIS